MWRETKQAFVLPGLTDCDQTCLTNVIMESYTLVTLHGLGENSRSGLRIITFGQTWRRKQPRFSTLHSELFNKLQRKYSWKWTLNMWLEWRDIPLCSFRREGSHNKGYILHDTIFIPLFWHWKVFVICGNKLSWRTKAFFLFLTYIR